MSEFDLGVTQDENQKVIILVDHPDYDEPVPIDLTQDQLEGFIKLLTSFLRSA